MTHCFSVPKWEDIRMVYNWNYSGIYSSLWAPHFALPEVWSALQAVERVTFMAYSDIGGIFLNFMLSEEVRLFCGVDVTNVRTEEE